MNQVIKVLAGISVLLFSASTFAGDNDAYGEAGAAYTTINTAGSSDRTGFGINVAFGKMYTEYLGAEIGASTINMGDSTMSAVPFDINAIARLPLVTSALNVYIKAGVSYDFMSTGSSSSTAASGTGTMYGGGLEFVASDTNIARLGYIHHVLPSQGSVSLTGDSYMINVIEKF
jgi:hypothetical protein